MRPSDRNTCLQVGLSRVASNMHSLSVRELDTVEDMSDLDDLIETGKVKSTATVRDTATAVIATTPTLPTAINTVNNAGDAISNFFMQTGSTAVDFSSQATKSVEEILKAGGRVTLAVGKLCSDLFGGISATLATTSGLLASGVSGIDSFMNSVPVLGVVTGGLNNVVTGLSTTVNELTANGRQTRKMLFQGLRQYLDMSNAIVATDVSSGTAA